MDWTPPSWDEIVRTHSQRVYRLAYRLTGNQHDAEDLTQEVFIRVFRSLSSYTPGTFEGWLHRITTNLFLDMVRRRARIRFDSLGDDAADRLPGRELSPERIYTDSHMDPDIEQALAALQPEFRAAVVLCDIEGLSYEEIAATLEVKLGTVRSRIHRGRAQLRAALAHRDPRKRRASRRDHRSVGGDPGRQPGSWRQGSPLIMALFGDHLGPRLAALVDGELSHDDRDRALAHIAGCAQCRSLVESERALKASSARWRCRSPRPA